MQYPLDTYRAFGQHCAYAHRTKNAPRATDLFALLWQCLDDERPDARDYAKAEFNRVFGAAYRSQWEPGRTVVTPSQAAPPPPPNVHSIGLKAVDKALKPSGSRTVADCAAFFRNHPVGA